MKRSVMSVNWSALLGNNQTLRDEQMKLETGKIYLVSTQRKGTFVMRVTGQDDTWTHGVIVVGKAKAMLAYNEREVGEEITLRTSFILRATEQLDAEQEDREFAEAERQIQTGGF